VAKRPHRFGGSWTDQKLECLQEYLAAYTKALQNAPFTKGYIDAFAGSGYRDSDSLPDLTEQEPQQLLEVVILAGDANDQLQKLCARSWLSHRAVLFLDPYGLQVDWKTIEAVAATKAIDMWLFPLGIGVNRLLKRDADIPPLWRDRLTSLLGTHTWFDEFYSVERTTDLFGDSVRTVKSATSATIGRYFIDRLKTIFTDVADKPLVLSNSRSCPLYLLCFAAGNPKGAPIAIKIANHLLSRSSGWDPQS